jgi:hypothetical protein
MYVVNLIFLRLRVDNIAPGLRGAAIWQFMSQSDADQRLAYDLSTLGTSFAIVVTGRVMHGSLSHPKTNCRLTR